MPNMKSLQEHSFGGKNLKKGDEFEANEHEAMVLRALGRAMDACVSTKLGQTAKVDTKATRAKRQYNRRDMSARQ